MTKSANCGLHPMWRSKLRLVALVLLISSQCSAHVNTNDRSDNSHDGRKSLSQMNDKNKNIDETRKLIAERIVGGNAAAANEFPSFGRNAGALACGATLIHKDIMLSASSCAKEFLNGVFIGGISLTGTDSEFRKVLYTYPHPNFNPSNFLNDILLIKLVAPSSKPIQTLNTLAFIPTVNQTLTSVGYGKTAENATDPYSNVLLKVQTPVVPFEECSAFYGTSNASGLTQICTNYIDGGKGICYGDGGGPLLTSDGTQVGIASYITGCARPDSYPGYTRITAYYQYIQDMICQISEFPPSSCAIVPKKTLKCGKTLKCPGSNWLSKMDSKGKCQNTCVGQNRVNYYLRYKKWYCGQTCF